MRVWIIGLLLAGSAGSAHGQWDTVLWGGHTYLGTSQSAAFRESSGIVASRTSPGIYWTHNDSGASYPRIHACRLNSSDKAAGLAKDMGYVQITGASNSDWEDISAGPMGYLYIFDGGDNPPCDRGDKRIHRFLEPTIDPNGPAVALTASYASIRWEYPDSVNPLLPAGNWDDRYDAECMLVHPVSGDIYIVTKRTNADSAAALVFVLRHADLAWNSNDIHVAEFIVDVSSDVWSIIDARVTAGDVDARGRKVVLRTYAYGYEYTLPPGAPFEDIFFEAPRSFSMLGELLPNTRQGEGICYGYHDGDMITTTEAAGSESYFSLYRVPWKLANIRAEDITDTSAIIRWDTADALNSRVDYGQSTGYGGVVSNGSSVYSHALTLNNLSTNHRYFYKVASGSLSYPTSAYAGDFYFDAIFRQPADLDTDGDVDLTDFGIFQACLIGRGGGFVSPICEDASLDGDGDVDHSDTLLFKNCLSGAGTPADPNCVP